MKQTLLILCIFMSFFCFGTFIETETDWLPLMGRKDILVIASPGRSGSSLIALRAQLHAKKYRVIKTHLMVPKGFMGRILFIFSNPDMAAESALHRTYEIRDWGNRHFMHMFSSDKTWLKEIGGDARNQTMEQNFLSYDALGTGLHLQEWLLQLEAASVDEANILAIKYENLWDEETQEAIKDFLSIDSWKLPQKRQRGYSENELSAPEVAFRNRYNRGTYDNPRYDAYDFAREIWEKAPPFQFLKGP